MTAFIDTNVLIYGQEAGAKSETARQVILAGGVISVQVLNEFAAVLRRKFGLEWAAIADSAGGHPHGTGSRSSHRCRNPHERRRACAIPRLQFL